MRIQYLFRIAVPILLVFVAGCASRDYKKGYATSRSLERTSENVQAQKAALQLAMGNLDSLINSPAADLRLQSKRFHASVDRLEAASNRTISSGVAMRRTSAEFFREWDSELGGMSYEVVRERSQARRSEVSQRFDVVAQRLAEAQEVVQPLISYLRDIEHALGTDLTLEGVSALKPIAENARRNSEKVETALGSLSGALDDAGSRMSPIIAAPAAPAAS